MFSLSRANQKYLADYAPLLVSAREAVPVIRDEINRAIAQSGYLIHSVTARAKTIESLRGKLRRKSYSSPRDELTDIVGARVITYYKDAVDPIAEILRDRFRIDRDASVDKRQSLDMREFGYRSVHLIASLRPPVIRSNVFLREHRFEIQVRSILEHAWAEIEHEVVYKSGIDMRDETKRRFAALAGGLELFDSEFLALRGQRDQLIEEYARGYERTPLGRSGFDVAKLLGFLEATLPEGRSWRAAEREGSPIAPGLDVCCVEALHAAGLGTPQSLGAILKTSKHRRYVKIFSAVSGIDPANISHLAVVILAIAAKRPVVLKRHFPELLFDVNIRSILQI